ncbi:hypothetical protein [Streptomyces cinereoruber]|uniref:hypothetical protein n=1 Tax=Streptomyces cinereoruber TaxID=67260 RepID=UPI00362A749A
MKGEKKPRGSRGRGRGRPLEFTEGLQDHFLAETTKGARRGEAAAAVGVHRNTPTNRANADPVFAERLTEADAQGKTARREKVTHGEYRYNVLGCRCDICTKAATAARTGRRHAAKTRDEDEPVPDNVIPLRALRPAA